MRALLAEGVGTFCLVFCGTGAIIIDQERGGVTHVGVGLTFGLVVLAMIVALGRVSGAHLNPAVTLAMWASRGFPGGRAVGYALAQVAGAVAASVVLRAMFPGNGMLGATVPAGGAVQSAVLEGMLTFILVLVILGSTEKRESLAAVAIGGVVALEAIFAGPVSGASMNPARSIGPAVVSGEAVGVLWVYVAGPMAGAVAAAGVWRVLRGLGTSG